MGSTRKQADLHKPEGFNEGVKNPWSKENWNLTEQGRMLKDNPELAKYFKENTRR